MYYAHALGMQIGAGAALTFHWREPWHFRSFTLNFLVELVDSLCCFVLFWQQKMFRFCCDSTFHFGFRPAYVSCRQQAVPISYMLFQTAGLFCKVSFVSVFLRSFLPVWAMAFAQQKKLLDFSRMWNKSIRRIWNLPYNAHCSMLPLLCQCLPVFEEFVVDL